MTQPAPNTESKTDTAPYYGFSAPYGGVSDPGEAFEHGFGLADLVALLRRRWEIILAIATIGTVAATIFGFTRPDIYSANAKLLIEPEHRVVDLDSVVEAVGSDAIAIETQINLLGSRNFLERFVTQSLLGVPLSASLVSEMQALKGDGIQNGAAPSILSAGQGTAALTADERATIVPRTVDELAVGLNVSQQGRSFIIDLEFSSDDPSKSAKLANKLAEFYIEDQANQRRKATSEASQFLEQRLTELQAELLDAERSVQEYRSQNPQRLQTSINTTSEQILDLTSLLVRARADRKEKEARLQFIADLRSSGESLESLTEVLSSPYMATLWEEESQLRSQEVELGLELGDNHPRIQTISAEREEVAQRIDREIKRIIENTRNELEVLVEREKSLRDDLEDFTGAAGDEAVNADKAQIQLRLLEGNADASRRIYEEFLLRLKQTREQEAIVQANTRLVARAQIPTMPSSRSPMAYVLIGLVGSSTAGLAFAYLRERTHRKVRTGKELVRSLGVTYLGLTPILRRKEIGSSKIHDYLEQKPASVYAETIRSVYTKAIMSNDGYAHKVFLVTSSLPDEGKTTFALSLATLLSIDGKKTVLVDLDLRHPSILKELNTNSVFPADNYLSGYRKYDRNLLNKHASGFKFIAAREAIENPGKAIRSKRLEAMIAALKENFDYVIIDGAPSLGLSDSKALLSYVDTCLFMVKWNDTPLDTVSDALGELTGCNCPIAGIVLTQVDIKKQMRYGYGGIDDYYGGNSNYYKN